MALLSDSTNSASTANSTTTQITQAIGQKHLHSEEPVTASGRAKLYVLLCVSPLLLPSEWTYHHRQKPDPLSVQGRHIGHTMDAFLNPGAMFNHGICCAALDSEDEGLDKQTPECVHIGNLLILVI
jgi:hypothetical protein